MSQSSARDSVIGGANRLGEGLLRQDLQSVARLIRPGERVLDLGCGTGDLSPI